MKVAIVHDWFVGGGAERVVYELHKMYPDAPIYTSYCSPQWREKLKNAKIITSYMQHWPFSKLRKSLPPLRALWFSRLDLSAYDLVISSSGAEAKGIRVKKPAIHINYCHAPTHYYWSRYDEYIKHPGFGVLDPLARLGLKILIGPMRRWDFKAAKRSDYMIANSTFTQSQIKKYYHREAEVIHPPVDIERFKILNKLAPHQNLSGAVGNRIAEHQVIDAGLSISGTRFLVAGRQTPYKRIDLAVAACTQLNLPLTVIGNGSDHRKLTKMAGPSVTFLTGLSDTEVVEYFQTAKAFIFPGIDDFGIVAVEALASGTPVIAYKDGGALDYIQPGKNGLFFEQQTMESLSKTLAKVDKLKFNRREILSSADQFSTDNFHKSFKKYLQKLKLAI